MVEAARTFFMSSFALPMTAPSSRVMAPMTATAVWALGAPSKTAAERTMR